MRTRYRAQQIIIDTPRPNDDVIIHVAVGTVDMDGDNNIINESPRTSYMHKEAKKIATNFVTITDPVTQKEHSLSVAGIHQAIQQLVCNWLVDEYDAIQEGPFVWQS